MRTQTLYGEVQSGPCIASIQLCLECPQTPPNFQRYIYNTEKLVAAVCMVFQTIYSCTVKTSSIDPLHTQHSIAVTIAIYHVTNKQWKSSKKTESLTQASGQAKKVMVKMK